MKEIKKIVSSLIFLFFVIACSSGGSSSGGTNVSGTLDPKTIPQFVDPLPDLGEVSGTTGPITVRMREAAMQILPNGFTTPSGILNPQTQVWRYEVDGANYLRESYLGPSILAQRNVPLTVNYVNELGNTSTNKLFKIYNSSRGTGSYVVDQTVHWASPLGIMMMNMNLYTGPIPAVVHLHGSAVPSAFDGGPDQWFTQSGIKGSGYVSSTYTYPNNQEATPLWYHDHTLGATRLNVYAGLAGAYRVTDPAEPANLPSVTPLIIQDRMFDNNGQLNFPYTGINPTDHPFWMPEFFGDVILVNGKTWPYLAVEAKRYRFLLLNASNARFYELSFGSYGGPALWVVRSDGGYLDAPVQIAYPDKLLIAPGERYEVIIDFTHFANDNLILTNTAKAPYPGGDDPDPETIGKVMQFKVGLPPAIADGTCNPALGNCALRAPMVRLANKTTGLPAAGVVTDNKRQLTLNEVEGIAGPLEVLVNNTKWAADITETPRIGSTEIWQIINLTEDAHPIHLHLIQFQLLKRQPFDADGYNTTYEAAFPGGVNPADGQTYLPGIYIPGFGPPMVYTTANAAGAVGGNPDVTPFLQGMSRLPLPQEAGWKDTLIMFPGEVTSIIVRWAPQDVPVSGVSQAGLNSFAFDPTAGMGVTDSFGYPGGPGYVWHCHILDHEDNEMMRPYMVTP